ncbi:MAG TPA: hypothetical protein VF065_06910, partial [Ilumatobacter sp.]
MAAVRSLALAHLHRSSGYSSSALLGEIGPRGCEHVEDPALAVLVVTDEHRIAVSHRARRKV